MKSGNRFAVVVTAEHASLKIPDRCRGLGLGAQEQESHIAWDEGSKALAREIARQLSAPLVEGAVSRLVIDLNRSLHHRRVIPAVAFGVPVPGNEALTAKERTRRIELYYEPFRSTALMEISRGVKSTGRCVHISVHTFTPRLNGVVRPLDVAVLYDPGRRREAELGENLAARLSGAGFRVRRNFPFRGVADGHTTALRRKFPDKVYAGVEIEVNQTLLGEWKGTVAAVSAALAAELGRRQKGKPDSRGAGLL
jgi:predicted N-formylglutamate amidohydrolase